MLENLPSRQINIDKQKQASMARKVCPCCGQVIGVKFPPGKLPQPPNMPKPLPPGYQPRPRPPFPGIQPRPIQPKPIDDWGFGPRPRPTPHIQHPDWYKKKLTKPPSRWIKQ